MLYDLIDLTKFCPVTIMVGHYGTGKTNLTINLALQAAKAGREVVVVDLDIVNPFFRSSDYRAFLEQYGIRLIAPQFAGTALDSPAISGEIIPAIHWGQDDVFGNGNKRLVLMDVGGDDVGATVLGRFAPTIQAAAYELLYVLNARRNLTQSPEEAYEVLKEVEHRSHLEVTGLVNNTHLQDETTSEVITEGIAFADDVAQLSGKPVMFTTVPEALIQESAPTEPINNLLETLVVQRYVRSPWE